MEAMTRLLMGMLICTLVLPAAPAMTEDPSEAMAWRSVGLVIEVKGKPQRHQRISQTRPIWR
jgi:hypothetical protein